jgi:hypothetical protein
MFERAVKNALCGVEKIPTTADGWQLYTVAMECGSAARALTAQCKKVVGLILQTPLAQKEETIRCLKEFCWYL